MALINYLLMSFANVARGLRTGTKVFLSTMNDWQYLSLGDLEQNEFFFPKVTLEVFLCLINHVKYHLTKN